MLFGTVRLLNIPTTTPQIIGRQDGSGIESKDPCSCLASLDGDNSNLIASAGWSKKFYLWDIRQPSPVTTIKLPGKAFDMDYDKAHNRLVIATSGRRTCFIDMKSSEKAEMVLERESSLKFQTRCVRFFPDGNGIALGSVEGRVGVEFLDELGVQSSMKKYAFKCHRVNDTVYPVNCIEFHPRFIGTFATGGCDGGVGKCYRMFVCCTRCIPSPCLLFSPSRFLKQYCGTGTTRKSLLVCHLSRRVSQLWLSITMDRS